MKKKINLILFLLVIICLPSQQVFGQNYQTAIGLRFSPDGAGISGKFFLSKKIAVEAQFNSGGIWGAEGKSYYTAGLISYHIPLPDPRWSLFYGGGIHLGFWHHDAIIEDVPTRKNQEAILGLNGIGGVDYSFRNFPITISADFKPSVNLLTETDFFTHNTLGFSIRFHLK